MTLHFEEHGFFNLTLYDPGILFVDATGPFNYEIFERYHKEVVEHVATIDKPFWQHIGVLRGLTAFTPDVIAGLKEHFRWRKSVGNISDAIVFVDAVGAEITKSQLRQAYDDSGIASEFFDSFEEAFLWTKQYEHQFLNSHAC